ncbi:MAG: hypothetical protein P8173_17285 [Gammaproteobacteria bacterium]
MNNNPASPAIPTSLGEIKSYRGLLSWVSSVDHKQIGILYVVSAFTFFLIGLTEALLMRVQLFRPLSSFMETKSSPCTARR